MWKIWRQNRYAFRAQTYGIHKELNSKTVPLKPNDSEFLHCSKFQIIWNDDFVTKTQSQCLSDILQNVSGLRLIFQKPVSVPGIVKTWYQIPLICMIAIFLLVKKAKVLLIITAALLSINWLWGKRCTYFNLFIIANKKIQVFSAADVCVQSDGDELGW